MKSIKALPFIKRIGFLPVGAVADELPLKRRKPLHATAMVFNAATVESVEFNASTGLLVIRNPLLALEQEGSILHSNGWTEASEADLPEEGLPPTPRVKGHHQSLFSSGGSGIGSKEGNKLKRGAAGSKESREGAAEEGRSSSETMTAVPAPLFGGNKRVYKRAG